jgi:vesicle coat complex subunit
VNIVKYFYLSRVALAGSAQAMARKYSINSPDDLAKALKDKNPYVRAQALAAVVYRPKVVMDDYLDPIATQIDAPNARVRSTVACLPTPKRTLPFCATCSTTRTDT